MNIFDIMGPVMVGPSSSHTAGAVKIGLISRQLMNEDIKIANIFLHGSFLATGKGHGTDRALIAGLLGMKPDDTRIPTSFSIAKERGMEFSFKSANLKDAHPNTALLKLTGINGRELEIEASSIGGSQIKINKIDKLDANFCGDFPTLIVHNLDQPGHVMAVTSMLGHKMVNIATMQLYRHSKGGEAVMIIECDQEIPIEGLQWLKNQEGVIKVTYLSKEGDDYEL